MALPHTDVRVSEKLSEAYTLPAWLYTNPDVLEAEKKEIFSKTWQYVGHVTEVQGPGDYITTEVADKPIIIARGNDGVVRAFYNVCTHRGSKLDDYEVSILDKHIYQGVPLKGITGDQYELGKGGRYYWLYPNMWFSFDPGPANVSIHQSIPIDHKTTKYIYTTFLMNETRTKEEEELFAMDLVVRKEDLDICEVVQKGLDTGAYTQGRFSLTENCVHHFHLLVQEALQEVLPLPAK
jgi:phenylpropionate dioxygenase-like ring-hydroxylating dioxygenase large terminal subunit